MHRSSKEDMDVCIACLPPTDRASGLYSASPTYTWLQAGHADTLSSSNLMQALHTPEKHGLRHHISQLLPSCVYYMVWWDTYGPACQWLQSEREKRQPQYDGIICACMRLERRCGKGRGVGNQAGRSNMHEWDRWRMRWVRGGIEVGIIKYMERGKGKGMFVCRGR